MRVADRQGGLDDLLLPSRHPGEVGRVAAHPALQIGRGHFRPRAFVAPILHEIARADGAPELRVIGETEFVNGAAAMAASGRYGKTRACAGIVGFADLALGAAVEPVLAAHVAAGNGRFRGIRHAAGWDASDQIPNSHTDPPPGSLPMRDSARASPSSANSA